MTKSTITRERLEQLADNNTICKVSWDERIELAQIALSAMDCEPVAWAWHYREQWHVTNDERRAEFVAKDGDVAVLPLYRHAQPAPVVPEEKPIPNTLSMYAVDAVAAIAEVKGWNACRAAMLAAAPQEALATECHALACELDIGDERTEMFEIYSVLHNLGRRGYACQVGRRMNPLLASCDDDDDEDDD